MIPDSSVEGPGDAPFAIERWNNYGDWGAITDEDSASEACEGEWDEAEAELPEAEAEIPMSTPGGPPPSPAEEQQPSPAVQLPPSPPPSPPPANTPPESPGQGAEGEGDEELEIELPVCVYCDRPFTHLEMITQEIFECGCFGVCLQCDFYGGDNILEEYIEATENEWW